jgi:hypothetical protein
MRSPRCRGRCRVALWSSARAISSAVSGFQAAGSSSGVIAAASRSRRKSQRRPTRLAGRTPRRASSYTVERGMPSRSATSLVDRTSARVSGRVAGVAIYLREARSRQSGPPGGADFGWPSWSTTCGRTVCTRGHWRSDEAGHKVRGFATTRERKALTATRYRREPCRRDPVATTSRRADRPLQGVVVARPALPRQAQGLRDSGGCSGAGRERVSRPASPCGPYP